MPSDTYTLTIADAGVSTPADGSVTTGKIANLAVTTAKLENYTAAGTGVTTAKLDNGAVTSAKIAATTITDANIAIAANIALSKLATGALPAGITVANATLAASATTAINATTAATCTGNAATATTAAACTGNAATATLATAATNLAVGTAGALPYQTAAGATAFISAVATGNVLLSGGAATVPQYGKVNLTAATHIAGTLPVGNGGTGVAASAYGQTGSQTAGTSTGYTTTYAKLELTTSLDAAAAQFDANSVNNRLRYTGSATRKFLVFASMDMLSSTNGAQFSIKIAKNGTVIDATQCNASVSIKSAGAGIAKLVSNWIIEFAQNDYVEIFVASVGSSETGTPQRMRLVATPVF